MKRFVVFASLALVLVFAMSAVAADLPHFQKGTGITHGAPIGSLKADKIDSAVIIGPWGSGAAYNGQFQDAGGVAAWNGWAHEDNTYKVISKWTVSNYNADTLGSTPFVGNLAAWCGYPWVACTGDVEGGYGNSWYEVIEWRTAVGDKSQPTTVDWDFYISYDSEPAYDYTYVYYFDGVGEHELAAWDDIAVNYHAIFNFSYLGNDYAGDLGDEIVLQIVFSSDSGWSDEDCFYTSMGGCQVDEINIVCSGASNATSFTDFEDTTLGPWVPLVDPNYVGDFAMLRSNLGDYDPCATNTTVQATFIDDGIVVPGTGGTQGINWKYGPGGFIVTTEGGLAGPTYYIDNQVVSPVMVWPEATYDGTIFEFDGYAHEDLDDDSPGMFYVWGVRSTDSLNPADIIYSGYKDRNFVYYGDPIYARRGDDVTNLMTRKRTFVQCRLTVLEYGYVWGWTGRDGYPAPYFDNVRITIFPFYGPALDGRELDRAQDAFPAIGTIDYVNLGANSCRFDMAQNISPQKDLRNDPGDSIIVSISAVRAASTLYGDPKIFWKMKPNHLFDAYRTSVFGTATSGSALGWRAAGDNYAFDLPDENFLFPGDVLHYYFWAQDKVGSSNIGTSIMPADTTGFSDFSKPLSYNLSFTVNCLPTIVETSPGVYSHPSVLFWNDAMGYGGDNEWYFALNNLGLVQGEVPGGYDNYCTNGPSSGVGNGLGGRAGLGSIEGYDTMLYTSGLLNITTLSNGDFNFDAGNDVELMDQWMQLGDKNLFMTGDNLISDLMVNAGPATAAFVGDYMGLVLYNNLSDLRPLINNQQAPVVKITPTNPVFATVEQWIAYGGCFNYNTFDPIVVDGVGQRLAEFTDKNGNLGAYNYSAATMAVNPTYNSTVISMPYDLLFIYDDPDEVTKASAPTNARTRVLNDVLTHFGEAYSGAVGTDVLAVGQKLSLSNAPNPFNPKTTINFVMPKTGHMTLKVYNVRGEQIRTLVDGIQQAGAGNVVWDGTNDKGAAVSTGVYFFRINTPDGNLVQKSALVR